MRLIVRRIALYVVTAIVAITINFFLPRLMESVIPVYIFIFLVALGVDHNISASASGGLPEPHRPARC